MSSKLRSTSVMVSAPEVDFKKTTLKNGIRVVSERHRGSRAASLGIFVDTGTRDEHSKQIGISHFLEHLVFKGTKSRSAYQIAKSLESLGGDLNAYTTRENTHYHCLVLRDHWQKGLEVLADLVCNMDVSNRDFEVEKNVILQEIASTNDTPEELIYDEYISQAYVGNPLSYSILGTEESIRRLKKSDLIKYYSDRYSGKNLVVSAAGDLDHDELVAEVKKYFSRKKKGAGTPARKKPKHKFFRKCQDFQGEQTHILLGIPATSFSNKLRFEAFIVNALLGGGMTSKLYQSIREKRGLVYSIYSTLSTFVDCGLIFIYAGTDPDNVMPLLTAVKKEFHRLRENGISKHDLDLFRTQIIGSILLGSDDVENRMSSLGVNEMVFSKYKSVDAIVDEINAVTVESVNSYIRQFLRPEAISGICLGPDATKIEREFKKFEF